jgi:hypothetical protein
MVMKKMNFMLCVVGLLFVNGTFGAVVDEAAVYLSFEGAIDSNSTSQCWANRGTAGFGETPGVVGEHIDGILPTITTDGLNGQAYDGTALTNESIENAYGYGEFGAQAIDPNTPDTEVEQSLINIWSFTVCGWVKNAGKINLRILRCPAFEINHHGWEMMIGLDMSDPNAIFYEGNASSLNFAALGTWKFFAITYDGTSTTGNLKFYYGSDAGPVTLDSVRDVDTGLLNRDGDGSILVLGNGGLEADRPYVGYIDELRIWANGPGDLEQPDASSVLTIEELEQVRQHDLTIPAGCASVHQLGYTLAGDINNDCHVTLDDFAALASTYLQSNNP